MEKEDPRSEGRGDEAPRLKDFIVVLVVVLILIAFCWVAWFKFGWFH